MGPVPWYALPEPGESHSDRRERFAQRLRHRLADPLLAEARAGTKHEIFAGSRGVGIGSRHDAHHDTLVVHRNWHDQSFAVRQSVAVRQLEADEAARTFIDL